MSTLVGNLVPKALNFCHVSVNKKCLGYITAFVGLMGCQVFRIYILGTRQLNETFFGGDGHLGFKF